MGEDHSEHEASAVSDTEYVCPMHPQIRQDEPGTCPICHMDLVPIANDMGGDAAGVRLSEHAATLARVQTSVIDRPVLERDTRLFGRVTTNQEGEASITAWTSGRIERLYVETVGESVERGQRLARLYSPEIVRAQETLLHAARTLIAAEADGSQVRIDVAEQVVEAARAELRLLGLSSHDIDRIIADNEASEYVTVRAPASGTVLERHVREGDHVQRGTPILTLANLDDVWVELEVPEEELPAVSVGDTVSLRIPGAGDETFEGEVTFIDPLLDAARRVAIARVVLENSNGSLRPEMFVEATLEQTLVNDRGLGPISIPASAVLWTGVRSIAYRVDRMSDPPSYVPVELTLGERIGDRYILENGLWPGEEVVTNGAFRIDATAQIRGQATMMNPTGGSTAGGGHAGH